MKRDVTTRGCAVVRHAMGYLSLVVTDAQEVARKQGVVVS
jgi:hypothetical protein